MKDKFLSDLNDEQIRAVRFIEKPLLIIAGAGSGKTRVITHKIAYLIREHGFHPSSILGVTFTNKAANEMKDRVTGLTGLDPFLFNISTFHSLGLRILRESGAVSGYGADWTVSDDKDQKKIVTRIIRENFSGFTNDRADDVFKKINRAKMNLLYPNNRDMLSRKGFMPDEIEIFSLYFDHQKKNKRWDFEDLISLPVIMLGANEKLRLSYRSRFRYVLVDEFQDTNPNQYELIRMIASGNGGITVVGDDDQAIYSWRGANVRFMNDFHRDFADTKIVKMERNYRSTKEILNFANVLIRRNSFRQIKEMWTDKESGNPVHLLLSSSKESEADQVADLIDHISRHDPSMMPVAVLYRINSQSLPFETVFRKRGIGYRIVKGLRFFDRKEIKDSVALLRLAVNPNDDISFLRMIDFLPLGIGPRTLEDVEEYGRARGVPLFRALKEKFPEKFSAKPLFRKILDLNKKKDGLGIPEMLELLLNESGYLSYLKERMDDDRILNIGELIDFIRKWESETDERRGIDDLLDRLVLESGKETGGEPDRVLLLTMHNSKGLEFPTVVAAGINETFMPFFMNKDRMNIEEERRLMYVASTRAIGRLVISTGGPRESRFISEAGLNHVRIAGSVGELLAQLKGEPDPGPVGGEDRQAVRHPLFGEGRVLKITGETKYLVDFYEKGEKVIDTSIIELEFIH